MTAEQLEILRDILTDHQLCRQQRETLIAAIGMLEKQESLSQAFEDVTEVIQQNKHNHCEYCALALFRKRQLCERRNEDD